MALKTLFQVVCDNSADTIIIIPRPSTAAISKSRLSIMGWKAYQICSSFSYMPNARLATLILIQKV